MKGEPQPQSPEDPFQLDRYLAAQERTFANALAEVRSGHKRSHWMWFIFPQLRGLGFSEMSVHYAISGLTEARAYLGHPVLGPRLVKCCEAVLLNVNRTAGEIFGTPDDMKLRSCATLFATVSEEGSVFHRIIEQFFDGRPDDRTLELLGRE